MMILKLTLTSLLPASVVSAWDEPVSEYYEQLNDRDACCCGCCCCISHSNLFVPPPIFVLGQTNCPGKLKAIMQQANSDIDFCFAASHTIPFLLSAFFTFTVSGL
jgi:hypothetical protein